MLSSLSLNCGANVRPKQIDASRQRLEHRESLQGQIKATVDRMRIVTSETALKYLEEDIVSVEKELAELDEEIARQPNLQAKFDQVLQYAKYILEHLSELLLDLCNPLRKAAFFGAIFNKLPTYEQINFGTQKIARYQRSTSCFVSGWMINPLMVTLPGIEPGLPG